MPAATDKFKKVGNPGTATTLSAPGYTVGATSLTVASTTNHPTDTGVCVSMYEVTTVGTQTVMTPGSYNEYNGVVSGATSITSLSHVAGSGTDRNYAAGTGTVVTIMVSSGRENDLVDGLLVSHNQDGTLKTGSVTTLAITDASVTTAKLADANVTEAKLAGASVTNAKLSTTAGEVGGAWVAYTPTWTGTTTDPTIGNGTLSGYYTKIGKTVHFRISIVFGTTTTVGSGIYFFGVPVAARAMYGAFYPVGTVMTTDDLVEQASGAATIWSSTTVACFVNVAGVKKTEYVQHAYPYAWATNDKILISGTYEAA